MVDDMGVSDIAPYDNEKKRYDDMMAIYAAMIDEIDKNVGKLVAALEERDQLDNTLILFLSDNGGNAEAGIQGRYEDENPGDPHSNVFIGQCWAHLNNTPFRKYKHYNHEGGTASPLIAHWPKGATPRESRRAQTALDRMGRHPPSPALPRREEEKGEEEPRPQGREVVPR